MAYYPLIQEMIDEMEQLSKEAPGRSDEEIILIDLEAAARFLADEDASEDAIAILAWSARMVARGELNDLIASTS